MPELKSKDERSLLLYLETQAVDNRGKVDLIHMNQEDLALAEKWDKEGFLTFKRLPAEIAFPKEGSPHKKVTHHVKFTDAAWEAVHKERRARADRTYWENKV